MEEKNFLLMLVLLSFGTFCLLAATSLWMAIGGDRASYGALCVLPLAIGYIPLMASAHLAGDYRQELLLHRARQRDLDRI